MGEVQSLWAWVGLRVTRENQTYMLEFLERRKMKNIREVRVEEVSGEVLQAVLKHKALKVIEMENLVLTAWEPTLLFV